jgi:hypothetical protein
MQLNPDRWFNGQCEAALKFKDRRLIRIDFTVRRPAGGSDMSFNGRPREAKPGTSPEHLPGSRRSRAIPYPWARATGLLMTRLVKLANRSHSISGTTKRSIGGKCKRVWHLEPSLTDRDGVRTNDCIVMSAEVGNMRSNDRPRNGVGDE